MSKALTISIQTLEEAAEYARLLDEAGVRVRYSCGCHGKHPSCIRQTKVQGYETEYLAYKEESAAGDKEAFFRCPNGHVFTFDPKLSAENYHRALKLRKSMLPSSNKAKKFDLKAFVKDKLKVWGATR